MNLCNLICVFVQTACNSLAVQLLYSNSVQEIVDLINFFFTISTGKKKFKHKAERPRKCHGNATILHFGELVAKFVCICTISFVFIRSNYNTLMVRFRDDSHLLNRHN